MTKAIIHKLLHCQATDEYAAVPKDLFNDVIKALEPAENNAAIYALDDLLAECSLHGVKEIRGAETIRRALNQPPAMPSHEEVAELIRNARYHAASNGDCPPWTLMAADAVLDLIKSKQERG